MSEKASLCTFGVASFIFEAASEVFEAALVVFKAASEVFEAAYSMMYDEDTSEFTLRQSCASQPPASCVSEEISL